jgi:hypothetical protein
MPTQIQDVVPMIVLSSWYDLGWQGQFKVSSFDNNNNNDDSDRLTPVIFFSRCCLQNTSVLAPGKEHNLKSSSCVGTEAWGFSTNSTKATRVSALRLRQRHVAYEGKVCSDLRDLSTI